MQTANKTAKKPDDVPPIFQSPNWKGAIPADDAPSDMPPASIRSAV